MNLARALADAEHRLRAGGLAGARAFDALISGLRARMGDDVEVDPLAEAVLADLPLTGDLLDLAWERFFPDVFKAAHGQYFTPPPVARLLVALADIRPGDDVLDPTCGAGGLLRAALALGARVRGVERDPGLAALARVQLQLAGAPPAIETRDWFAGPTEPADVVVANPPFSLWISDPNVLRRFGRDPERRVSSEDLFVSSLGSAVLPGGRAAVVLPWSILHNPRRRAACRALEHDFMIAEDVALPEGIFRPFGGAGGRAVVLGLRRRPCPGRVRRSARVHRPGYDVRSVHLRLVPSDEIDELIAGRGWKVPQVGAPDGRVAVARLARLVPARAGAVGASVIDLADVDRETGEVAPRTGPLRRRRALAAGEVWVSRLRPDLGAVGWAPDLAGPLAGSPEWIALDGGDAAGWLAAALRTPAWRAGLPTTTGQTRPRTTPDDVLAGVVRPSDGLGPRWTAVTATLLATRARARTRLEALQRAMDAYQSGAIELAALEAALSAAEEPG